MILPVFGIDPHGSSEYKEIMKMLRQLGLSPTGNIEIDRSRLRKALETRKEKFEITIFHFRIATAGNLYN